MIKHQIGSVQSRRFFPVAPKGNLPFAWHLSAMAQLCLFQRLNRSLARAIFVREIMTLDPAAFVARAQRFPLQFPLCFRETGEAHWMEGTTLNVSRTGMLFRSDEAIPVNSQLDIRMKLLPKLMLSCQGAVVVRSDKSTSAVKFHRYRVIHSE